MNIVIVYILLFLLSVYDIREKSVPLGFILTGFLYAGIRIFVRTVFLQDEPIFLEYIYALIPGIFFFGLALITGSAGMGDALVLLILGLCFDYRICISALAVGLFVSGIHSLLLLILGKADKGTRFPFIPFLTLGWVTVIALE